MVSTRTVMTIAQPVLTMVGYILVVDGNAGMPRIVEGGEQPTAAGSGAKWVVMSGCDCDCDWDCDWDCDCEEIC